MCRRAASALGRSTVPPQTEPHPSFPQCTRSSPLVVALAEKRASGCSADSCAASDVATAVSETSRSGARRRRRGRLAALGFLQDRPCRLSFHLSANSTPHVEHVDVAWPTGRPWRPRSWCRPRSDTRVVVLPLSSQVCTDMPAVLAAEPVAFGLDGVVWVVGVC